MNYITDKPDIRIGHVAVKFINLKDLPKDVLSMAHRDKDLLIEIENADTCKVFREALTEEGIAVEPVQKAVLEIKINYVLYACIWDMQSKNMLYWYVT